MSRFPRTETPRDHGTTIGTNPSSLMAIALFKLGFNETYNNPKTVYVAVYYESPETGWPPIAKVI